MPMVMMKFTEIKWMIEKYKVDVIRWHEAGEKQDEDRAREAMMYWAKVMSEATRPEPGYEDLNRWTGGV